MIQTIFFALLIVALIAGYFTYHPPSQNSVSPMKFMMDNSGYTSEESVNRKRSQSINMKTSKGLMQVRQQMDDLALAQNKIFDAIQEQQRILKSSSEDASNILLEAKRTGALGGKDVLQLDALMSEMQDQQRLLVDRGQGLIDLNNQISKNRQTLVEQLMLANINTDNSLNSLQQQNISLNNQASDFLGKVNQYNQDVRDQMNEMQGKLQGVPNNTSYDNAVQQQSVKESVQRMLDQEHEEVVKLADNQERSRNLLKDEQQHLADSKEQLNNLQQKSRDLIDSEQQKQKDQQIMIQQRLEDQEQRMKDMQDR